MTEKQYVKQLRRFVTWRGMKPDLTELADRIGMAHARRLHDDTIALCWHENQMHHDREYVAKFNEWKNEVFE